MLNWEDDKSIARSGGMDERAVLSAIDAGARVVMFETVASYGLDYHAKQRPHLVFPGELPLRVGLGATCFTALLGWWGVGVLETPVAIYRNLRGGVEVTLSVRRELEERLEHAELNGRVPRFGANDYRVESASNDGYEPPPSWVLPLVILVTLAVVVVEKLVAGR